MLKEDWEALSHRLGYSDERAMFLDLYEHQGISVIDLGERLGFTRGTIARRLGQLKITKRSRGGANNEFAQRFRLWRFDQRMLRCLPKGALCEVLSVGLPTLQSYLYDQEKV